MFTSHAPFHSRSRSNSIHATNMQTAKEILQGFYAAETAYTLQKSTGSGDDPSKMLSFLSPDVKAIQSPDLPWGGVYEGIQAVGEMFEKMSSMLDIIQMQNPVIFEESTDLPTSPIAARRDSVSSSTGSRRNSITSFLTGKRGSISGSVASPDTEKPSSSPMSRVGSAMSRTLSSDSRATVELIVKANLHCRVRGTDEELDGPMTQIVKIDQKAGVILEFLPIYFNVGGLKDKLRQAKLIS